MPVIHCGYKLSIDEKTISHFNIADIPLVNNPFTAIQFNNEQWNNQKHKKEIPEELSTSCKVWFRTKKRKELTAFLRYLFIDTQKKIVVAQGTIDGEPFYITLSDKTKCNYPAITLKKMANEGKLGEKHPIETVRISCYPYIFTTDRGFVYE